MIGETVTHFRIVDKLGEGGMGIVYKAEDVRLERPVALKFLPPHLVADLNAKERFLKEARAASALDHANICAIHEIDETENGGLFIAMAFYAGETLLEKLQRGPLPVKEAVHIARQVAQGLSRAHGRGIVHRDIKPANLMITDDGVVKILDFGIAKLSGATRLTGTSRVVGTVTYMSPEQAESAEVSAQADVWALGVVLYEMLAGHAPFQGATPVAVLYQVMAGSPEPLTTIRDDLPANLDRIVSRCLAKDLATRYATMGELLADLDGLGAAAPDRDASRVPPNAPTKAMQVTTRSLPFLTPGAGPSGDLQSPIFVGREREMGKLMEWLAQSRSGQGRVGFITGEAGYGKTALAREFCKRAAEIDAALLVAWGSCNAHSGVGDPYHPFREILGLLTGDVEARWAAGSVTADHATRLWSVLPLTLKALLASGPDLVGTVVADAALVARSEAHPSLEPGHLSELRKVVTARAAAPNVRQADLFEQYCRVLRAVAHDRPLLLVLDDLQWADPGSVDLLFHLGRQLAGSRILVVGLYRLAEVALGRGGARHPLDPVISEFTGAFGNVTVEVGREEDREFIDQLLDAEPNALGTDFRDALFRQTRGHALFAVELVRSFREQGLLMRDENERWIAASQLDWNVVPVRVDAVIGERINRLSPELQRLLTVASVEGEEFTLEAIAAVLGTDVRQLIAPLSVELEKRHRLVVAQGFRRTDGHRRSVYRFQHVLFQRHLYDRLDAVERAFLHGQLGEALEAVLGGSHGEPAAVLAHHFREAGADDKAAEYLQAAGAWAKQTGAATTAIAHFRDGLDVLRRTAASPERDQLEMALCLSLGSCTQEAGDYASAEAGRAFTRAADLARALNDPRSLLWARSGLYLMHHIRSSLETARHIAEAQLRVAEDLADPVWLYWGRDAVARNMLGRGDLPGSLRMYERALADVRSPPGEAVSAAARGSGWESEATALSTMALVRWLLGYPDRALDLSLQGSTLVRQAADPTTPALSLLYQAWVRIWRREVEHTAAVAAEFRALVERRGLSGYQSYVLMLEGWCEARSGRADEGIALLRDGLRRYDASGQTLWRPMHCGLLVDPLTQSGRLDEADALLREALAAEEATGDVAHRVETLRLQGELLRARGEPRLAEAEQAFRQAIEVARGQEAKSYELRATTSFARLLQSQGRCDEAREMLNEIYGWFTEGFDTADLKEAKALLGELEVRR